MKKETIFLIIFLIILVFGGIFLLFYRKTTTAPQGPDFVFPKVTTTPTVKPTEITLPLPPGVTNLGKIKKFEAKRFQSGDFINEYLLVYKEDLEPKTKLYMPYDGYILYYPIEDQVLNFQIHALDEKKVITFFGNIEPLCQVTETTTVPGSPPVNYCENVKKGTLIGQVDIEKVKDKIALRVFGIVNHKDDLNFLYGNLPLIFK